SFAVKLEIEALDDQGQEHALQLRLRGDRPLGSLGFNAEKVRPDPSWPAENLRTVKIPLKRDQPLQSCRQRTAANRRRSELGSRWKRAVAAMAAVQPGGQSRFGTFY